MAAIASSRWMQHVGGGRGDPLAGGDYFKLLLKLFLIIMNNSLDLCNAFLGTKST